MFERPEMYVDLLTKPRSTEMLNSLFFREFYWLTWVEGREYAMSSAVDKVAGRYDAGVMSFACVARRDHPTWEEADLAAFVLDRWREVAEMLGLDLSTEP